MFVVRDLDTPSNKNVIVREGLLHVELLFQQPRSLYYQDGNHQDLNTLQSSVPLGEPWLGPKGDLPYLCRSNYKPTAWAIVFNGYWCWCLLMCVQVVTQVSSSRLCDLHEIVDTGWRAISGQLTQLEGSQQT